MFVAHVKLNLMGGRHFVPSSAHSLSSVVLFLMIFSKFCLILFKLFNFSKCCTYHCRTLNRSCCFAASLGGILGAVVFLMEKFSCLRFVS